MKKLTTTSINLQYSPSPWRLPSDIPWLRNPLGSHHWRKLWCSSWWLDSVFKARGIPLALQDPSKGFSSYPSPTWHPGFKFLTSVPGKQFFCSSTSLMAHSRAQHLVTEAEFAAISLIYSCGEMAGLSAQLRFHGLWVTISGHGKKEPEQSQISRIKALQRQNTAIVAEVTSHTPATYGQSEECLLTSQSKFEAHFSMKLLAYGMLLRNSVEIC